MGELLGRPGPGNICGVCGGVEVGSRVHRGEVGRLGTSRLRPYLGVDIQHAHLAGGNHTPDGVDACAIQVALVFSMFQVASRPDVGLHLPTGHKAIALAFPLRVLGPPGCVWGREGLNEHMQAVCRLRHTCTCLTGATQPSRCSSPPPSVHCCLPMPHALALTIDTHRSETSILGWGLQSSLLQPSAHRWGS